MPKDIFFNCEVCGEKENEFIMNTLAQLQEKDLTIFSQNILRDQLKVIYLNSVESWVLKSPQEKKQFEQLLISYYCENKSIHIKKIQGSNDLYRIELTGLIYSSFIIYSFVNHEIVVQKRMNNFIERTDDIQQKLITAKNNYPNVLNTSQSIQYVVERKCSLSRYGDGELNLCYGLDIPFQKHSSILQNRLVDILQYKSDEKILITIPEFNSAINNISQCCGDLTFWENYWLKMYNNLKHLFVNQTFGNTDISRNTVFHENKVQDIKLLWHRQDVVFVLGRGGRFEIKSDLFDNICSYSIIFVPPINAFEQYSTIMEECLQYSKDKVFLMAAGPTATVLSFDLMQEGYRAMDIGHLPNCYDQYNGTIKFPESLPFVREDDYPV